MKQSLLKREYFKALPPEEANHLFSRINHNPDNVYRTGFEYLMNRIPVIHGDHDPMKQSKLMHIESIFRSFAQRLSQKSWAWAWVWENWPSSDKMHNLVTLGIDQFGGELVMARWNPIETSIHGHECGQMIDFLVSGKARQFEYDAYSDNRQRFVHQIGYSDYESMSCLSNEYNIKGSASNRAIIHKFIPLSRCLTLHYIPHHPRNGKGNIFNEPKN